MAELRTFVERPLEAHEVDALIRHCVRARSAGAPAWGRVDERVARVLAAVRASDTTDQPPPQPR